LCKEPGAKTRENVGRFVRYHWTCSICGAYGTTVSRDPKCIMWRGVDASKVVSLPRIPLDEKIADVRGLLKVAWKEAEKAKTVESWKAVEALERELLDLMRKKNSQALYF
jgi:hypothetical protein